MSSKEATPRPTHFTIEPTSIGTPRIAVRIITRTDIEMTVELDV